MNASRAPLTSPATPPQLTHSMNVMRSWPLGILCRVPIVLGMVGTETKVLLWTHGWGFLILLFLPERHTYMSDTYCQQQPQQTHGDTLSQGGWGRGGWGEECGAHVQIRDSAGNPRPRTSTAGAAERAEGVHVQQPCACLHHLGGSDPTCQWPGLPEPAKINTWEVQSSHEFSPCGLAPSTTLPSKEGWGGNFFILNLEDCRKYCCWSWGF